MVIKKYISHCIGPCMLSDVWCEHEKIGSNVQRVKFPHLKFWNSAITKPVKHVLASLQKWVFICSITQLFSRPKVLKILCDFTRTILYSARTLSLHSDKVEKIEKELCLTSSEVRMARGLWHKNTRAPFSVTTALFGR